MKTKLSLESLKVHSFITVPLANNITQTIKGGSNECKASHNPEDCNNFVTAGVETQYPTGPIVCGWSVGDTLPTYRTCNVDCQP